MREIISLKVQLLFLLMIGLFANNLIAQNQVAYLRSTTGTPWGSTTNEAMMDVVFGVGNWDDLRYETVDVSMLLNNHSIIFFEGSEYLANEMETFLNTNQTDIENWVASGGNIFINAGANEGDGMNLGFGGVSLVLGNNLGSISAADTNHPIFNGPYLPVGTTWTGNSICHGTIQGTDLIDLASSGGSMGLAMKYWGAGKAIFGSMTTVNYHQPAPEVTHLRQNILDYLKSSLAPIDAGITGLEAPINFCSGNQDIIVNLANLGLDTLTSVEVNWEYDGVLETPYTFNGTLDTIGSGNNITNVTLGSKNFNTAEIHTLRVWTSLPNGIQDTINVNDTLSMNLGAGLNGIYTIGGNTPDYSTINDAITDLGDFGICGPVTFNIRNGLYNEQILLTEVTGASAINNITFQSENGDSTDVIVEFAPSNNAGNYVWHLDGADFITIKGITFKPLGTSYDYGLVLGNNANNNIIENNFFDGNGIYGYLIYSGNSQDENNIIQNNYFQEGRYGIYFLGANLTKENGNIFRGNQLEEQTREAIYIQNQLDLRIEDNDIESFNSSSTYSGIRLYNCDGAIHLERNTIVSCCRQYGIYMENNTASSGNEGLIANNFISLLRTTGTANGIYAYSCDYQKYYHNTLNVFATDVNNSRTFLNYYGSNIDIRNNIISNKGGGYAIYTNYTSSITISNNNDLYTTGPNIGYWNGNQSTFLDWKIASGLDGNSVSIDPFFVSDSTYTILQVSLNNVGQALAEITTDIEGEARNLLNPDIGADEFSPAPNDAGMLSITSPAAPFPSGTYPIYGILKNYGENDLSNVDLHWEINDVTQTTINWTGSLASGDTLTVLLGNMNFDEGIGYSIDAWTDLPNGAVDVGNTNDSTNVSNVYAALGGIYTLGGTSPDFNDFASVESALNYGGVHAAVTINIRDGVYNEQIHLTEIIGASASENIVFQSESADSTAVTIEFAPFNNNSDFLWYLDGTDFVTLRGLTFKSLGISYDNVLVFENGADYNVIENNYFDGNGQYGYLVYSTGFNDENNTIQNNHFQDGRYGIYLRGLNSSEKETGNIIKGNILREQTREAMYIQYQDGVSIEGNTIESFTNSSTYSGVLLSQCNGGMDIRGNTITSCCRQYGFRIDDCYGALGEEGIIANNFVSLLRANGSVYGIRPSYSNYLKIYHNTINIHSDDVNYSRAFDCYYGSNIDLRNNILSNEGGGYALYTSSTTAITTSDHNDLYTTGISIAYWNGQAQASLADWQANSTQDANSISIDPFFESDTSYVIAQVSLNGAGEPVPEVTTDIEGSARDLTNPDIGAYIFTPAMVDAGAINIIFPEAPFPVGNQQVTAIFKNFGTNTLTSVVFDWEINGIAQTSVNWTGNLLTGDTVAVDLSLVDFQLGVPYSFKVWTDTPNGGNDLVSINDTTTVNDIYAGIGGTYTLGGNTPDFADFAAAAIVLNNGGVYAPVDIQVRDGLYSEQVELFEILGASSTNQVIFESENNDSSLVTLSYLSGSSNDHVFRLNGTDWLTVKGMTIATESNLSYYIKVIELLNGATNNTFMNNHLLGGTTTSIYVDRAVVYIPSTGLNEYNGFVNNVISNGSAGIFMDGNYNDGLYTSGNYLVGNRFENQYIYGAYIIDYQSDLLISDNEITTNTTYANYYGLSLDDLIDNVSILRNRIIGTSGYGIW